MRSVDGRSADPYTTKPAPSRGAHSSSVSKRLDRIQVPRLAGGVEAEGDANTSGEAYRRALVGGTIPFILR